MVKSSKVYQRIAAAPTRPIAFRLFEKCVISFGFTLVRSRGSHQVFEHPEVPRPLILQPNGKDAKAYQQQEFLDMVERYKLGPRE